MLSAEDYERAGAFDQDGHTAVRRSTATCLELN